MLLHAKRILIHEEVRRVKTKEAVRDLPIAAPLERVLASHLARIGPGPDDLVFPDAFQDYKALRRTWDRTCAAAEVAGATPHDARHTFAVHTAQAGIPIVRLQKLLGHADRTMTMRYMKHAAEGLPRPGRRRDRRAHGRHVRSGVDRPHRGSRRELRPA